MANERIVSQVIDLSVNMDEAGQTASRYITLINPTDGIKVHRDRNDGTFIKVNADEVSMWQDENKRMALDTSALKFFNRGDSTNPVAEFGANGIKLYEPVNHTAVLTIDNGGLSTTGTITAGAGSQIGPWNVTSSSIYKNSASWGAANGMYFGDNGLSLSNTFKVSNTGALNASSVSITGGSISIGSNFSVNSSGNLTANGANITGTVNATSFVMGNSSGLNGAWSTFNTLTGLSFCNGNYPIGTITANTTDGTRFNISANNNIGINRWNSEWTGMSNFIEITSSRTRFVAAVAVEGNISSDGTITADGNIRCAKFYTSSPGNSTASANARIQDKASGSNYHGIAIAGGSSRRYKHEISPLQKKSLDASLLYNIEVVQFKYKDDYLSNEDQRSDTLMPGFIAEQVAEVYPIAIDFDDSGQSSDWNERFIIPPMLKLIQDQHKEIEELKSRLDKMEEN